MTTRYRIKGMTCEGCVRAVTNAIRRVAPEARVAVDLTSGTADIDGTVAEAVLAKAVNDAGFEFAGRI